jgi:AcrR family transcriptional regulator
MAVSETTNMPEKQNRIRMPHYKRERQIVETARGIIKGRGIEYLTIKALAKEIGVSDAALYRHVTNKQQILLLVLEDVERTLLDAVVQAQKEGGSALQKLQDILKSHLSLVERRRGVSFLVLNETLRLDNEQLRSCASELLGKYLGAITHILREGQAEGCIKPDVDVDLAARLFLGMVQSNVTIWALQSHRLRLSDGYEGLWELYRGAVGGHE